MRKNQPNPCSKAACESIDDAMREKWWVLSHEHHVTAVAISQRFSVSFSAVAQYIRERKKLAAGVD